MRAEHWFLFAAALFCIGKCAHDAAECDERGGRFVRGVFSMECVEAR